jgi:tryptophan synthase alpha chain
MNRIDKTLANLRMNGRKMLSPYITAGDPHPELTVPLMHELVKAGADVLELGIPFSDPMAEGPVIQRAMERALSHSVHCKSVLNMVKEFRQQDNNTPIIVMGYLNPIEQYGYDLFAQHAIEAGVDGTILVDLPPEEAEGVVRVWSKHGLYCIFLCSPTTTDDRIEIINRHANGYLYYVSLKGVTGSNALNLASLQEQYQMKKRLSKLPMMVGFGIKSADMAAKVSQFADGVIVGAALIERIIEAYNTKNDPLQAAHTLIYSMREAIDNIGIKA